jgi:hypothetical protein
MPAGKVQSCAAISPNQDTGFSGCDLYMTNLRRRCFALCIMLRLIEKWNKTTLITKTRQDANWQTQPALFPLIYANTSA